MWLQVGTDASDSASLSALVSEDLPYQPTANTRLPAVWAWAFDVAACCVSAEGGHHSAPEQQSLQQPADLTAAWPAMRQAVGLATRLLERDEVLSVADSSDEVQQLVALLIQSPAFLRAMQGLFRDALTPGSKVEDLTWQCPTRCTQGLVGAVPRAALVV